MHKACGGAFQGKYIRDMRRATVLDSSSTAWGLNSPEEVKEAGALGSDLLRGFAAAQKED
jgi:alpha-ketoglutarate-dependent 2,4-dichlorophenoxyacetate dioxygenase